MKGIVLFLLGFGLFVGTQGVIAQQKKQKDEVIQGYKWTPWYQDAYGSSHYYTNAVRDKNMISLWWISVDPPKVQKMMINDAMKSEYIATTFKQVAVSCGSPRSMIAGQSIHFNNSFQLVTKVPATNQINTFEPNSNMFALIGNICGKIK
jgi:hypothetical protein